MAEHLSQYEQGNRMRGFAGQILARVRIELIFSNFAFKMAEPQHSMMVVGVEQRPSTGAGGR